MTQIILNIEDDKYKTFLDFIKTLSYVSLSKVDEIPQWQKDEVAKSIKEIDNGSANLENWDKIKANLFEKHQVK